MLLYVVGSKMVKMVQRYHKEVWRLNDLALHVTKLVLVYVRRYLLHLKLTIYLITSCVRYLKWCH